MTAERDRENLVFMAKVAQQSERYDDMVDAMKQVAKLNWELTVQERNLLADAYKQVIDPRRNALRMLSALEEKEESKGNEVNMKRNTDYKQKFLTELCDICNDVINIIDQHLLPNSETGEFIIFCHKLKGDYFRYLAEFNIDQEDKVAADKAYEAYEAAANKAISDLPATHPTRLGVMLNFSVFYSEILGSPIRACHLAKEAFDDAMTELEKINEDFCKDKNFVMNEEMCKDSAFIMQLLEDNISMWTSLLP